MKWDKESLYEHCWNSEFGSDGRYVSKMIYRSVCVRIQPVHGPTCIVPVHSGPSCQTGATVRGEDTEKLRVQTPTFFHGHLWDLHKTEEKFLGNLRRPPPTEYTELLAAGKIYKFQQHNFKNFTEAKPPCSILGEAQAPSPVPLQLHDKTPGRALGCHGVWAQTSRGCQQQFCMQCTCCEHLLLVFSEVHSSNHHFHLILHQSDHKKYHVVLSSVYRFRPLISWHRILLHCLYVCNFVNVYRTVLMYTTCTHHRCSSLADRHCSWVNVQCVHVY